MNTFSNIIHYAAVVLDSAIEDAEQWVTVGKGKEGEKGHKFKIDTESGKILAGGSPAMKGKTFKEAFRTEKNALASDIAQAAVKKHGKGTVGEYLRGGARETAVDYNKKLDVLDKSKQDTLQGKKEHENRYRTVRANSKDYPDLKHRLANYDHKIEKIDQLSNKLKSGDILTPKDYADYLDHYGLSHVLETELNKDSVQNFYAKKTDYDKENGTEYQRLHAKAAGAELGYDLMTSPSARYYDSEKGRNRKYTQAEINQKIQQINQAKENLVDFIQAEIDKSKGIEKKDPLQGLRDLQRQYSEDPTQNPVESQAAEIAKEQAVLTEEDYLSQNGAGRFSHAESALHHNRVKSNLGHKQNMDRQAQAGQELREKRESLRKEYQEKIASGEIRQPTREEQLIRTAQGHEDNESVQAARRLLEKRGINWKSSKTTDARPLQAGDVINLNGYNKP